jgi:hypothetical protein
MMFAINKANRRNDAEAEKKGFSQANIRINRAAAERLGFSPQSALGKSLFAINSDGKKVQLTIVGVTRQRDWPGVPSRRQVTPIIQIGSLSSKSIVRKWGECTSENSPVGCRLFCESESKKMITNIMKAMLAITPGGAFVSSEIKVPEPGPGQVRVKVHACGVCAGEYFARHGLLGAQLPRVPGHEIAGTVDAVGLE